MNQAPSTPRWETAVMVGSFILIWAYFLARQAAGRAGENVDFAWNVALGIAVVVLVIVFVKRLQRTLAALRDIDPGRRR